MKMRSALLIAAAAALLAALAVPATVFPDANNAFGPLYPVAETSMLVQIKSAAARYMQSDAALADRRARRQRAVAYVNQPPVRIAVPGATKDSLRIFDPSVTLHAPVHDRQGRLLHPAGSLINPFAETSFAPRLVFFDDRDLRQRAFARAQARKAGRTYPILVAGSPTAFAKASGLRAYFDQDGALARRLAIESYPAVVTGQGHMLRIETRALAGGEK
ncbi:MAG: hypothetical protein OXC81_03600 [Betaproteobacteria bacterium]|nr:hypothetical protein [Betaproteobacteria bacterium]